MSYKYKVLGITDTLLMWSIEHASLLLRTKQKSRRQSADCRDVTFKHKMKKE